jgi:hypothetical protein
MLPERIRSKTTKSSRFSAVSGFRHRRYQLDELFESMLKQDVKYRFVIDMTTLQNW